MSLGASVISITERLVERADGWVNVITGLGTPRDKVTATQLVPGVKLSVMQLESLFNDDDLSQKIVSKIAREATRRGFTLELDDDSSDEETAETNRAVMKSLHDMDALQRLREAWIWGRLYGGGAMFMGVDDGQDPALPLNEAAISTVRFMNVLRRPQLHVKKRYDDPTAAQYGEPELYEVYQASVQGGGLQPTGRLIHATRLITFGGALTATQHGRNADGWEDSVLQACYQAVQQTAMAWQSSAHLISDASQGVLAIANLVDLISAEGQPELRTRMQMMDMARSVCRAILVDADRERFERVATSFAGLPEMLDRLMMRLAAAAEMPVTVLFGRSAAGLNATGENDIRGWYDTVQDAQHDVLRPRLERLLEVVMLAKDGPTGGKLPEQWEIKFRPLWQPTDKEQAEVLKIKSETQALLVEKQIVMEAEAGIGLARDFPWINIEHRQKLLEADLAEGLRPGEATTREESDPDDDPTDPDDGEEGGSGGTGPKARGDSEDARLDWSALQPRDRATGKWSSSSRGVRGAQTQRAAARAAFKAAPSEATRAAYGEARAKVRRAKERAKEADGGARNELANRRAHGTAATRRAELAAGRTRGEVGKTQRGLSYEQHHTEHERYTAEARALRSQSPAIPGHRGAPNTPEAIASYHAHQDREAHAHLKATEHREALIEHYGRKDPEAGRLWLAKEHGWTPSDQEISDQVGGELYDYPAGKKISATKREKIAKIVTNDIADSGSATDLRDDLKDMYKHATRDKSVIAAAVKQSVSEIKAQLHARVRRHVDEAADAHERLPREDD